MEDDRRADLWNEVYKESVPLDLREKTLSVDPLFDTCLMMFADQTERVLDFGCGTGDILFQYAQYKKKARGVGVDPAKQGIDFAKETAKKADTAIFIFLKAMSSFWGRLKRESLTGLSCQMYWMSCRKQRGII